MGNGQDSGELELPRISRIFHFRKRQVTNRDVLGQPDPVGCPVEGRAFPVHGTRCHLEHYHFPVSAADRDGGFSPIREVDVMPLSLNQTGRTDRSQKPIRRSVIEHLGRPRWLVTQVYWNGMALIGSDPLEVFTKGETLLVAGLNDSLELIKGNGVPVTPASLEQVLHGNPSGLIERDTHDTRLMPKHEAKELAGVV